jgi:hypothetical protein
MARSNKALMRTRGAMENLVWFIGGFAKEVLEIDNFVDCFQALTGTGTAPEVEDPAAAISENSTQTTALEDFFKSLLTVIEFLCYIKDTLVGYFTAENKRLLRMKRHQKMNFVEKRRRMSKAMVKKSWSDLVSWVKTKVGQVATAISTVTDKVTTWATATWEKIRVKYRDFKAWVSATWTKIKAWFAKAAGYIEKFNGLNACVSAGKTLAKPVSSSITKLKEWITNIVGRVSTITQALAGSPTAIATVAAGVICAIPHIVKLVAIYKDTSITNSYYRWGRIVARAGFAFTA